MPGMAGELLDNRGRGEASWGWPPIHPEGRKYGLIATVVSLAVTLGLGWHILGMLLLALSAGVFAFFRDPERVVPQGDSLIVSPADGLITQIVEVEPPIELQMDGGYGLPLVPQPDQRHRGVGGARVDDPGKLLAVRRRLRAVVGIVRQDRAVGGDGESSVELRHLRRAAAR